MNWNLLNQLLDLLPLYSEEDDLREELAEADFLARFPTEAEAATLAIVRRLFEACCLLDQRRLKNGTWAFVSYPASLAARSLLQSLATPGQTFFPLDYWRSQSTVDVEEQRRILKELESRRERYHPARAALPVRYVYVAWGLIRLGGKFLLHHREDKTRKEVQNYVFPGGRLKPGDLPLDKQTSEGLRQLHCSQSSLAIEYLPKALAREMQEETTLLEGVDFTWQARLQIEPYRKLEGAGNKHAYTEYLITLYDISLTPEGETKLLEAVSNEGNALIWFSAEDIESRAGRQDGKTAFIDAMREHLGPSLIKFLSDTPDSSTMPFRLVERSETVEIPTQLGQPFMVGETGKEKREEVALAESPHALLLLAGLHARSISVAPCVEHVHLHPGGWVQVCSDNARATLHSLSASLAKGDLRLLDVVRDDYFRLSVKPDLLYFNDSAYCYRLPDEASDSGVLELFLELPSTDYFDAVKETIRIPLKKTMVNSLQAIATGDIGAGDLERFGYSEETMKKNIKEMLDERTRRIGLRKLVRQANKRYQIAVRLMDK